MINVTDTQKIGIGLTGFGVSFLFLGVLLLFDKGLIAMGNTFFLAGLALLIGLKRTFSFFFQVRKWKGSVCFFGGMIMVLVGWPFFGILVEFFGFLNLFRDFFPVALSFARRLPVLGTLLNLPLVKQLIDFVVGQRPLPV
eukprot:Colp12_sorted_trinity150504_noHs@5011